MRPLPAALVAIAALACAPSSEQASEGGARAVSPRTVFGDDRGQTLAVLAGKTLYLSGVGPSDIRAEIGDQTRSAMDRLGEILARAELDHSHLVSCHVHLADMDSYSGMNSVYGSYFEEGSYPARTTIEMPGLPDGAGVLLMCVAYADPAGIAVVRPPSEEIPPAMGPYSPAVRAGATVYLSGQGGRDPVTGTIAESTPGQAEQTLRTIGAILGAADLGYDNAVLGNSYVPPSADVAAVQAAFESVFSPGGAPSGSTVALSRLPGDILVEITFVATSDRYVTRLFMHDQPPSGASSPVSLTGGVAYTSATPGTGETFREQFESAASAQASALNLAILGLPNAVRVIAYLSDMENLSELRELMAETFPVDPPALTAVQTRADGGSLVALEMIAVQ